jgi:branched-chain amino acid transport system permease protein
VGYLQGILILISINIVAVCGVIILTGYTGLFSLGHAGFVSIGAYFSAVLCKDFGVPFILAMVLGGLVAALSSVIVGYPTLRGKLKGDYFAIAMMGFAEAIRLLFSNIYPYFNGALGLSGIPKKITLGNALLFAAVVIFFTYQYVHSQHGRLALSIREQEVAAELIGVNVTKEKMKSLMISAFLCGVSGGMTAFYYTYMTPNTFSAEVSNNMLSAVVFGGMGSISGPVIASAILTAIPEVLRAVARWRLVIYGLLMVVVMLFRPEGLLGNRELSLYPLIKKYKEKKAGAKKGER